MKRYPCDGTWQDYHRHRRAKEEPCRASKRAWADRAKERRAVERGRKQDANAKT